MEYKLQESVSPAKVKYTQQTSCFVGCSILEGGKVLPHSQVENSLNCEETSFDNNNNNDLPLDLSTSSRTNDECITPPSPLPTESSFACVYCLKAFAQKRYLMTHLAVHGLRRPGAKTFKCSFCDKEFPYKHLVSKHELVHSDVKPFKCLTCGEDFRHKVSLVKHGYKHTGVKPVACPHTGCDKTFTSRSHVKDHYRLHTGERPFGCTLCRKTFVQKSALNVHMQMHAGVKPFACSLCCKSFTSKPSLAHHLQLHAKGVFFPLFEVKEGEKRTLQRKASLSDFESKLVNDCLSSKISVREKD